MPSSPEPMPLTPLRWFLQGFLIGVLICGALNALSYFVRSDGWGNLLGLSPLQTEAMGFPWRLWESENAYGGMFVDVPAMTLDLLFVAVVGTVLGLAVATQRQRLDRLVDELERAAAARQGSVQFSLRGLLMATAVVALATAGGRQLVVAARPESLAVIYALGPWILVAIAFLPRGIPWQHRAWILVPCALVLIGAAVFAGAALERPVEVDKVLLGIFVCWTPQSALTAVALSIIFLVLHRRTLMAADAR